MFDTKGNVVATGDYLNPRLRLKAGALEDRPEPPVKDGKWSFYNGKGRLASVVHYKRHQTWPRRNLQDQWQGPFDGQPRGKAKNTGLGNDSPTQATCKNC